MAAEATHGLAVSAATVTTTVETLISAAIQLPARGNPWTIHHLTGVCVPATLTAAEAIGGILTMDSASGDMNPDPAPSQFPVYAQGSILGATGIQASCPLNVFPINIQGAGKATINLNATNDIASTVAPVWGGGILFSPNLVGPQVHKFCGRVRTTFTAAGNAQIGTITLSEKATRITGVMGVLMQDGVLTTAEELTGVFSITSDDVDLVPMQFLPMTSYGAGLGTAISNAGAGMAMPLPVSIPVPGGARIDCFINPTTAVTNAANAAVYVFYE